jgi:cytoskeletal protein CcmA (bactofilin family)
MEFNFGQAFKDWWQSDLTKPAFKAKAALEPGANFEGKLIISSGTSVRLNTHFKGEVVGEGTILVAERGELEARVECKSITVLGKLMGSVHASDQIEIKKRAVVLGDLSTPSLVVDPGGYFDGHCHMPIEAAGKISDIAVASAAQDFSEHPTDELTRKGEHAS